MNIKLLAIITAVFTSFSSYSVLAATPNTNPCTGIASNSFAGRVLCNSGATNITSCAGCHGDDGNSMAASFPKLAGQNAKYITNQLLAFKDGNRSGAMMQGIAKSMNTANMREIAEFYARLHISSNTLPELDEDEQEDLSAPMDELMAMGKNLYQYGNKSSEVPACIACHGVLGDGNKPAGYPALAAQHATYLIKSLADFKAGDRTNNPDNIMHMIAQDMTKQEIEAVAYYLSMLK